MKYCACIFIKILQLIACVSVFILKKLADTYSDRMLRNNIKNLREWTLLNSISLSKESDEFSILTIMGFTFVSAVLLLTRFIEKTTNYHTSENIFLCFGVIFFAIQGLLLFGAAEQLSDNISDFAFSLGGLSFLCAVLFSIDFIFFRRMAISKDVFSQTDLESSIPTVYIQETNQNNKIKSIDQCCSRSIPNDNTKLTYLRTDL
ncbi:uncharacterized protein LOC117566736 [Drosophila albomicans]|uniref:Uncharacterized protein LOC117566736 n=1 Tax=Drosophila albomicans TaxID=7291 RepID=A0A6P8WFH4_DROAB|nr:uncharacterized protein LOC117566736 [Drosophila albomicans]